MWTKNGNSPIPYRVPLIFPIPPPDFARAPLVANELKEDPDANKLGWIFQKVKWIWKRTGKTKQPRNDGMEQGQIMH